MPCPGVPTLPGACWSQRWAPRRLTTAPPAARRPLRSSTGRPLKPQPPPAHLLPGTRHLAPGGPEQAGNSPVQSEHGPPLMACSSLLGEAFGAAQPCVATAQGCPERETPRRTHQPTALRGALFTPPRSGGWLHAGGDSTAVNVTGAPPGTGASRPHTGHRLGQGPGCVAVRRARRNDLGPVSRAAASSGTGDCPPGSRSGSTVLASGPQPGQCSGCSRHDLGCPSCGPRTRTWAKVP